MPNNLRIITIMNLPLLGLQDIGCHEITTPEERVLGGFVAPHVPTDGPRRTLGAIIGRDVDIAKRKVILVVSG